MMDRDLQRHAGSAILWRGAQLAGTKIIFFMRLFVLARLLSPTEFGLVAVAMVAIDVLVSITNFGMIPALVQQKDARNEHYDAAWTVGLLRSLTITAVVFLGAPIIIVIVDEPRVLNLVRVLAFIPTIDALASIGLTGLMRKLAFRELAVVDMAKTLVNTVISIVLAPSVGVWALVAGSLAGSLTYTTISYLLAPYRPQLRFDWRSIQPLIRYGRWIFLTSLVAVSGSAVVRIVVSRQLGATELGLYFLAARLAFLPTEVAGEVVGGVAFPIYARLQTQLDQAAYVFRAHLIGLSALLIPTFTMIAILAPGLVRFVLGTRWQGTEQIIQMLVVIGILGLVTDIAVPAFKGLGYPVHITLVEGAQSLLLILFIYGFTQRYGLLGAPLAWFPAIFGSLTIAVVALCKIIPRPFDGLTRPMLAIAMTSLLGGFTATAVTVLLPTLIGFILTGLVGVGVIAGLTWFLDRHYALAIGQSLAVLFPQVAWMFDPTQRQKVAAS